MSVTVVKELAAEQVEMRKALCQSLMDVAATNRDLIVMDADLMSAIGTKPFQKAYPDQTINCGIQEANMVGVACGLSVAGKVPFVHSFGPFATRRVCDQIYMSGAYAKANVKIIGSDPGITAQLNGGTHMPFEDMGMMRAIPTMTVLEPTDVTMMEWMIPEVAKTYGMHYLRVVRKGCMKIFEAGTTFEMGKAVQMQDGTDVTIIASGYCVAQSLEAARKLAAMGHSVRLLNMFCWKPIDVEAICRAAADTGAIVTAENHNVVGGLGSAVAEVVVRQCPVPMEFVGVQDQFGEVGKEGYLAQRFGLTCDDIVAAAVKAMARK